MSEHCCDRMDGYLKDEDELVDYIPKFREYGVPVHDGGQSHIVIRFCPWCGTKLPLSLRDEWFAELEGLGHADSIFDGCPVEFETDEWWKAKGL